MIPRRVFITGGSGFIGGEVIRLLLSAGHEVRNLDIAAPHFPEQIGAWIEGDIRDRDALEAAVSDFEPHVVLHLASDTDVATTDPAEFTTTINGTANVIAALKRAPGLEQFLHTSTQFVVMPGVEPRDELYLEPYTTYGEAKAQTERMVRAADIAVPWLILRATIIWGPHHPTFATEIFRYIQSGKYLHPSGRSPIMRAFGYVRNVAAQIVDLMALPTEQTNRRVFYLGDETIDYDRWADAFSMALAGRRARRIPTSLLTFMGQVGDIVKQTGLPSPIDSGRAFRMSTSSKVNLAPTHALVGQPNVSFDQGVEETLAWLRERAG